jgi:hypothetical protein
MANETARWTRTAPERSPADAFSAGDHVSMVLGPLKGAKGIVCRKNAGSICLSLTHSPLGYAMRVPLEHWVQPEEIQRERKTETPTFIEVDHEIALLMDRNRDLTIEREHLKHVATGLREDVARLRADLARETAERA